MSSGRIGEERVLFGGLADRNEMSFLGLMLVTYELFNGAVRFFGELVTKLRRSADNLVHPPFTNSRPRSANRDLYTDSAHWLQLQPIQSSATPAY